MISASDWIELQRAIDEAAENGTIQLTKDYKAGDGDKTLTVASGKSILLDLNGYTLDGAGEVGLILKNNGTLTIKDSTNDKKGKITGGSHSAIENYGTMTIEAGSITGNTATNYGGAIDNRDTLTIAASGCIVSLTTINAKLTAIDSAFVAVFFALVSKILRSIIFSYALIRYFRSLM